MELEEGFERPIVQTLYRKSLYETQLTPIEDQEVPEEPAPGKNKEESISPRILAVKLKPNAPFEASPEKCVCIIISSQVVHQRFEPATMYKQPKLLQKTPSIRAIKNYYNMSIDDRDFSKSGGIDNFSYLPEKNETILNVKSVVEDTSDLRDYLFDFNTMGTMTTCTTASEINSERNDMGSTAKLVTTKMSSQTWFTYMSTVICTISMAANLGNIYRLPQITLIRGGLPFLVSYVILTLLIGLPLLFLELGIGQLAQEGFVKSWRAVPFFRGIGYVKLIAGCLLSVYYAIYMALSLYYIIWLAKEELPFQECAAGVRITDDGYSASGKTGQDCLRKTFLYPALDDPYWFGIFCGILLVIWILISTLSIRKTRSYMRSLTILLLPTLGCYIALTAKSIISDSQSVRIIDFVNKADWNDLSSANTWYFAAIQVFFSTNVGFGSFITNAGIMYNKVNLLWTALGYITINLIFGVGSVLMFNILSGDTNLTITSNDIAEVRLTSLIYDMSSQHQLEYYWAIVLHLLIIASGFISMATIIYTILKTLTVWKTNRLQWWQTSLVICFIGFIVGCALLLKSNFDLIHLLDHYIVGNLILISVILEVFVFISFYGMSKIRSDFEFIRGRLLSPIWTILWWIMPVLLTSIFAWGLATLNLEKIYKNDPAWLYVTGWTVVLLATLFIFVIGFLTVLRQDGYTLIEKLKSSMTSSPKWGPKDPIQRYNWVKWNSKMQEGERDFTLKRRGTRDYTRSVKKRAKKAQTTISDLSPSLSGTYNPNNNNNYTTEIDPPYYINPETNSTIIRINGGGGNNSSLNGTTNTTFPSNINPLARSSINYEDGSNSEGYGTFRKGPYVINNDVTVGHVCHRKFSDHESATEL